MVPEESQNVQNKLITITQYVAWTMREEGNRKVKATENWKKMRMPGMLCYLKQQNEQWKDLRNDEGRESFNFIFFNI